MPRRKTTQTNPAPLEIEAVLWEAADKLRSNMDAAEYKHVVLGLIFLKYVSDAFETQRTLLETSAADPVSDLYISEPELRYEVRDRVYASLVAGDGKLYAQLRDGTCLVLAAKPEYEVLAENKLGGDDELFSGTPALAGGRIFLRSSEAVYCVGGK